MRYLLINKMFLPHPNESAVFQVWPQVFTSIDAVVDLVWDKFGAFGSALHSELIPLYLSEDYLQPLFQKLSQKAQLDEKAMTEFKQKNEATAGHVVESIGSATMRIMISRANIKKQQEAERAAPDHLTTAVMLTDLKADEKRPSKILKQNIPSLAKSIDGAIAFFGGLHARAGNKSPLTTITRSPIYDSKHNTHRLILKLGMLHQHQPYPLISQLCNVMRQKFELINITAAFDKTAQTVLVYLTTTVDSIQDDAILFLKQFTRGIHPAMETLHEHLCYTVWNLNLAKCQTAIDQAQLLPEPPKKTAEEEESNLDCGH